MLKVHFFFSPVQSWAPVRICAGCRLISVTEARCRTFSILETIITTTAWLDVYVEFLKVRISFGAHRPTNRVHVQGAQPNDICSSWNKVVVVVVVFTITFQKRIYSYHNPADKDVKKSCSKRGRGGRDWPTKPGLRFLPFEQATALKKMNIMFIKPKAKQVREPLRDPIPWERTKNQWRLEGNKNESWNLSLMKM